MFHSSIPLGAMCKDRSSADMLNSSLNLKETCETVTLFQKVDRIDALMFSFRFPSEETKVFFSN